MGEIPRTTGEIVGWAKSLELLEWAKSQELPKANPPPRWAMGEPIPMKTVDGETPTTRQGWWGKYSVEPRSLPTMSR